MTAGANAPAVLLCLLMQYQHIAGTQYRAAIGNQDVLPPLHQHDDGAGPPRQIAHPRALFQLPAAHPMLHRMQPFGLGRGVGAQGQLITPAQHRMAIDTADMLRSGLLRDLHAPTRMTFAIRAQMGE